MSFHVISCHFTGRRSPLNPTGFTRNACDDQGPLDASLDASLDVASTRPRQASTPRNQGSGRGQHDATRRAADKRARGNATTRRHTRAAGGAAAAARAHRVGGRAGRGDTDAQNLSTGRHQRERVARPAARSAQSGGGARELQRNHAPARSCHWGGGGGVGGGGVRAPHRGARSRRQRPLLHWRHLNGGLRPPHAPAPGAGCVRISARGLRAARHPLLAGVWHAPADRAGARQTRRQSRRRSADGWAALRQRPVRRRARRRGGNAAEAAAAAPSPAPVPAQTHSASARSHGGPRGGETWMGRATRRAAHGGAAHMAGNRRCHARACAGRAGVSCAGRAVPASVPPSLWHAEVMQAASRRRQRLEGDGGGDREGGGDRGNGCAAAAATARLRAHARHAMSVPGQR